MRSSPIVEAILKETPTSRESTLSISDANPLLPLKKKSKDNLEDAPEPRKLKRGDSRRMTTTISKKEFIMKNLGFSFLMSSSFKKNILDKLRNLQITVKFEVLTRKNLIDTLTKVIFLYFKIKINRENTYDTC